MFCFFFSIENLKHINEIQDDKEHLSEEPWIVNNAVERTERLQSTEELNSLQKQKKRNDTLFIGMFLFVFLYYQRLNFNEQMKSF